MPQPDAARDADSPDAAMPDTVSPEQLGLEKYTSLTSLRDFFGRNDVALVRASHFLSRASRGGSFSRRQDLPPEAFVDSEMLERSFAELDAWDEWSENKPCATQSMQFPPFVVVSYAWGAREHPDADGRQLREVLSPAIEWYMSERAELIRFRGVLGPHILNPFDSDGCDFCIFLDYSSMYQHSPDSHSCVDCRKSELGPCEHHRRSPSEERAFKRALGSMDLLYAHQRTCVWRMTRQLDGQSGAEYKDRGWPTFETSVSWLITLAPNCLDLGTMEARKVLRGFKGRERPAERLAAQASYLAHFYPGVHGKLQDARRPPILPDDFERDMETKALTNGKDKEVVIKLQREVATTVLGGVESLDFSSLGWGPSDAELIVKALPLCTRLATLNISYNQIADQGAALICEALRGNGADQPRSTPPALQ